MKSLRIWLLMMSSSIVHADSVWDKDISSLATSLALEQSNNIYNSSAHRIAASAYTLTIANNSTLLFEGYGLALPFSISHATYSNIDTLDNTAYQLRPQLQLFLSPDATVKLNAGLTKEQLISGDSGVELFKSGPQPLSKKQQRLDATLQIGKAPENRFFSINIRYLKNNINNDHSSSSNDSRQISSRYGYKISEDSYLQLSGRYASQRINQLSSQLVEGGLGFITGLGGSNKLNVIVGGYKQIAQDKTGLFWTISDRWKISDLTTLNFSTSQRSVLSTDFRHVSQVTTTYQLDGSYQLNQHHEFLLALNNRQSKGVGANHYSKKQNLSIGWNWRIFEGIQLHSYISVAQQQRSNLLESPDTNQRRVGLKVAYQW